MTQQEVASKLDDGTVYHTVRFVNPDDGRKIKATVQVVAVMKSGFEFKMPHGSREVFLPYSHLIEVDGVKV